MNVPTTRRRSLRNAGKKGQQHQAKQEEKKPVPMVTTRKRRGALKDLTNENDEETTRKSKKPRAVVTEKAERRRTRSVARASKDKEEDDNPPSAPITRAKAKQVKGDNHIVVPTRDPKSKSSQPDPEPPKPEKRLPLIPSRRRSCRLIKDAPIYRHPANYHPGYDYQYAGVADDIDFRDFDDPTCATDYVLDMYNTFHDKEAETCAKPYLHKQPSITHRMRAILVDWLVEVHSKFRLTPETLYLAVNLVDRFLMREELARSDLQLLGVTSLMIAAKYEEIYPLGLTDLVYICDNAYTRRDVLDMETTILNALEYQVVIHSAHRFLLRYLKAAHADKKIVQLSCMILDGALISSRLLEYLPSQLAAAAVAIARHAAGRHTWSPTLLKYARYSEEEVLPVAKAILVEKRGIDPELNSIRKKYSSSRYGCVAETILDLF
ncbi:B-type cyclin [Seminavis robusta]|uniref:B-type cyclin n=1 Tax=Seminavis robusta TaxID=568900 RepID=A0A9N8DFR4_9STRA|nr:B-type cyclin [Seminavis robusta]|eukprot:Sro103_g052500.1 B-type cyclin (436) ;mRNA; f:55197-56761